MGLRGFGGLVEGAVGFWAGFCLLGFGFADFGLRSFGVFGSSGSEFRGLGCRVQGFRVHGVRRLPSSSSSVALWGAVGHLSSFAPLVCKDGFWVQCFVQARHVSMRAEETQE